MKNGGDIDSAAVFICYGTIISCYYLATCPEVLTFDGLRSHFSKNGGGKSLLSRECRATSLKNDDKNN